MGIVRGLVKLRALPLALGHARITAHKTVEAGAQILAQEGVGMVVQMVAGEAARRTVIGPAREGAKRVALKNARIPVWWIARAVQQKQCI